MRLTSRIVRAGAARRASQPLLALLAAAALSLAGLSLAGCGASATIDPVARAAEVSAAQPGATYTIDVQMSSPSLPALDVSIDGSGELDERQHSEELTAKIAGLPSLGAHGATTMHTVSVYPRVYLQLPSLASRLPDGKSWIEIDLSKATSESGLGTLPSLGEEGDPARYLTYLRASSGDVDVVGHQTIDGVPCTHYRAVLQKSRILERFPADQRASAEKLLARVGASMPIEVWVDARQRVRRTRVSSTVSVPGAASGASTLHVTATTDFTSYGVVAPITAPPASAVFDATSIAAQGLRTLHG